MTGNHVVLLLDEGEVVAQFVEYVSVHRLVHEGIRGGACADAEGSESCVRVDLAWPRFHIVRKNLRPDVVAILDGAGVLIEVVWIGIQVSLERGQII